MAHTPTTLHLKVDADATAAVELAPRLKAVILDGLGAALANGGNLVDWDALAEAAAAQVMTEILRVRQATPAEAAIARVRRLCELTIAASVRVQAIDQARDTLAALDGTADAAPDIRADKNEPTIENGQVSAGESPDNGADTVAGIAASAHLRKQYATAIDATFEAWRDGLGNQRPEDALTDAVLAVRDRELEELRAKVAEFDHIINWHTTCASCARILDSAYQETMRAEKAEQQRDQLAALVRDFRDPDPCRLDHHGYCQAHSWMCSGNSCPHARAREVLAALDEPKEQP